jgi:pimeloyl-ACP methyl ester carboxylesterase
MKTGWRDVAIGGVQQWVSVRGEDASAPVLLFLHGGPGASEYGPRRKYLRALERSWRVVDWDQRGTGRSFRGDEDATVLTLDRLVLDGVELVEWVCNELLVERVVLVGHSFGTVLGVLMSQKVPARIGAYVGAAQVVQWARQEELGYAWALAEARRLGKIRAVEALERLGRPAHGMYAAGVRGVETQRRWLGSLGGVSADPSFLLRYMLSTLTCIDYPLTAKLRYLKAMRRSMECLWSDLSRRIDLVHDAARLDVPVFLFAGRLDRITDLSLIELWYATVEAPKKRLDVVELAGHLAPFEAPEPFMACLETARAFA